MASTFKILIIILYCISISSCEVGYGLVTSIYEVPKRHKVDKYYSFSVKLSNAEIKKDFTATILCKHYISFSAYVSGWRDGYSTQVNDILFKDDIEQIEWQLTGIYCPINNTARLPRGLYKKVKSGQIYYYPFLEDNKLVSFDWSFDKNPKYQIHKKKSTIFDEPNEYPIGYIFRIAKLLEVPPELESIKKRTVIGDNESRCKEHPLRDFSYVRMPKLSREKSNHEYMQRGLLSYNLDSDTWNFDTWKTGYRFADVAAKAKKDFQYGKNDCISLVVDNTIYRIASDEYIWIPSDKTLIRIDYLDDMSLDANMYIEAPKKCNDIPSDILHDIEKYADFKEIFRVWTPKDQKNSQYPQKRYEVLMKVNGAVQCLKRHYFSGPYFGW